MSRLVTVPRLIFIVAASVLIAACSKDPEEAKAEFFQSAKEFARKGEKQKAIVRAEYEARRAALEGKPVRHEKPKAQPAEDKPQIKLPGGKKTISDNPLDGLDLDEPSSSSKGKKK